jgi:membrane protein implicated in regulation of membrane protease activity
MYRGMCRAVARPPQVVPAVGAQAVVPVAAPTAAEDFSSPLPALAGFLAAFGFGGAIVASMWHASPTAVALAATAVGLGAGIPAAWLAGRLMDAAVNMHTDATLTSMDLVGATGKVVRAVPDSGYGEVYLTIAGQQMKFNAKADQPLARGTRIFVIEVPTPTSVLVEPIPEAR